MTNDEEDPGCDDPQRRPARPEGQGRSAAWDVTPWNFPLPFLPLPEYGQGVRCIRGSRAQRLGSRTDKSPTAKLPLEWPTQEPLGPASLVPLPRREGSAGFPQNPARSRARLFREGLARQAIRPDKAPQAVPFASSFSFACFNQEASYIPTRPLAVKFSFLVVVRALRPQRTTLSL